MLNMSRDSVARLFREEDGVLKITRPGNRYKRTYTITDVIVPTEHLAEVREFFRQIDADEKASAVLRRATTASAAGAAAAN